MLQTTPTEIAPVSPSSQLHRRGQFSGIFCFKEFVGGFCSWTGLSSCTLDSPLLRPLSAQQRITDDKVSNSGELQLGALMVEQFHLAS